MCHRLMKHSNTIRLIMHRESPPYNFILHAWWQPAIEIDSEAQDPIIQIDSYESEHPTTQIDSYESEHPIIQIDSHAPQQPTIEVSPGTQHPKEFAYLMEWYRSYLKDIESSLKASLMDFEEAVKKVASKTKRHPSYKEVFRNRKIYHDKKLSVYIKDIGLRKKILSEKNTNALHMQSDFMNYF